MSRRPTCCCTSSLPQAPRSDLGNRHLRQHRLQRQRLWRRFVRSGAGPPNTMGPEASRAGCAQACRDTAPMVADRADSIFLSGRILMILLPDRPLRLNVISMPSARRNVCSRRKRPASAQVFLGQPVTVPRSDATAPTSAGTQKVGAATCPGGALGHDFPHASGDRVGIIEASFHRIEPVVGTVSAVAISDLRLTKPSAAAGLVGCRAAIGTQGSPSPAPSETIIRAVACGRGWAR
jgi:hypothetical protein